MASRDLVVRVIGDSRSVERAFARSSKAAGQFNVSMVRTRDVVRGVFAAGGITAGAAGFAQAITGSVRAASNLEEQINKVNVVFGRNAREIQAWSRTTAASFGLSQRAALEAAGGFGQILETSGLTADEASKFSRSLVQLAADIASFNNIDPSEALDKLRSGLAGEAEPLRRIGVLLSEARVKQEAYRLGIARTGEELTEGQKVQARYALILHDTATAQGDFGRTSTSLANQQRILGAQLENLRALLGRALLPAIQAAAEALSGFLADSRNQERVQNAVQTAVDATSSAFRVFADIVRAVAPTVRAVNDALGGMENTIRLLLGVLVASKVTAFATSLGLIGRSAAASTGKVTALRVALSRLALIGVITIPIEILLNKEAIDRKVQDFLRDTPILNRLATKQIELADLNLSKLQQARNDLESIGVTSGFAVDVLNDLIERLTKVKSKRVTVDVDVKTNVDVRPERESGGGSVFAGDIIGAVNSVIEGSRKAVDAAITKAKSQIRTAELEKVAQDRSDQFAKAIEGLRLNVDRAELDSNLRNDLDVLLALKAGLDRQIKAGVDVAQAKSELVGVTREIAAKQKEIQQAAASAVQASQFRALGLSSLGDQLTPTVANLRRQLDTLSERVIGSDVPKKLTNRLAGVGRVLSGEFGKVTEQTRAAIAELFNTIRGEFDNGIRKPFLTQTRALDVGGITKGLGLDTTTLKQLQGRLSQFNTAGLAVAGARNTGVPITTRETEIVLHNHIILDGQEIALDTQRRLQKRGMRTAASTRGQFPGRRSGI